MSGGPVRFRVWGCRGSLPVPGAATLRHGGETSCYELATPEGTRLVVDCGSGLRALGERMMREGPPETLDVLLTHPHFDHLIGLGFFAPLLQRRTLVRIWTAGDAEAICGAVRRLYSPPLWPVRIPGDYPLPVAPLGSVPARFGAVAVTPFPLNHPGGASGYRLDVAGRSVAIVTDHEHGDAAIDAGVRRAVAGADLMVYDAAYIEADFPMKRGWGHSTWEEALRVAQDAGVRRTLLVHHSTHATDADLAALLASHAAETARFTVARDGLDIAL